jgi:hypothetical protein
MIMKYHTYQLQLLCSVNCSTTQNQGNATDQNHQRVEDAAKYGIQLAIH